MAKKYIICRKCGIRDVTQPGAPASATPADKLIADALRRQLTDRFKGMEGDVYADLSGRSLTAAEYATQLDADPEFLLAELTSLVPTDAFQSATSSRLSITPQEQRAVAEAYLEWLKAAPRSDATFFAFLAERPSLAMAFSNDDFSQVISTLRIEHGVHLSGTYVQLCRTCCPSGHQTREVLTNDAILITKEEALTVVKTFVEKKEYQAALDFAHAVHESVKGAVYKYLFTEVGLRWTPYGLWIGGERV